MNAFLDDIRGQGDALRSLVGRAAELEAAVSGLDVESFERIVLSGMGGSHYAAYPAWLRLVDVGRPAWWLETSELLHHARRLLDPQTLLWLTSQSGESIEIVELLRTLPTEARPTVVGLTNTSSSTLADAADVVLELHAGQEHAVSTRTYVNTLAAFAVALAGPAHDAIVEELEGAALLLDGWLDSLESSLAKTSELLAGTTSLVVVGRGASLAAARAGALTIKEAAKVHAEALSAGEFRHGPIELARAGVTIVILAGAERTRSLNERLAVDLLDHGARVLWLGDAAPARAPSLPFASLSGDTARSIAEIVSLQLCSVALARLRGIEPGVFEVASKVTTTQ